MRNLSKYVVISVAFIFILTGFSLLLTTPLKTQNTNTDIFNEEWLKQTLLSNTTNTALLQSAHILNSQTSAFSDPLPCFGPYVRANIDRTSIEINQTITITGKITPPEPDASVRVMYVKPDYTFDEQYAPTDPLTGEFTDTRTLDMAGFWNIFPSHGHITDRLYANVTDPSGTIGDPSGFVNPWKWNIQLIATSIALICIGIVVAIIGLKTKTRKISSLRVCIQILLIFLIFMGMFIDRQNFPQPVRLLAVHEFIIGTEVFGGAMADGLPAPFLACYYPCGRTVTCALWELQSYIYPFLEAGRGWGVEYVTSGITRLAIVMGMLILSALLLGRFWCGWVCPFGLYHDALSYFRKHLKIKRIEFSDQFNKYLHQFSYVILAIILIISIIFASYAIAGTQLIPGTEPGGFVYTYLSAPFCTVCPMKPLCLLMQNQAGILQTQWLFKGTSFLGDFYHLGRDLTSINLIILVIITAAAFFIRRFWCRICPMGGLLALFNRFPPFKWISAVRIDKTAEKCTKCGICKRVCPTQVTEVYEQKEGDVMTSQCIGCLRCIEMCPHDDTLKFKFAGKTVCRSRNWLDNKSMVASSNKEEKMADPTAQL
jgi:polyferredoxin